MPMNPRLLRPSTPTGDPYFSYVSLLMHMDGTNGSTAFTDSSSYARTLTSAGVTISTSQKKFGTASGYFNGSSEITAFDAPSLDFGCGDFTVECWVYPTAGSPANFFVTGGSGGGGGYFFGHGEAGLGIGFGRAAVAWDALSSTPLTLNEWQHVAFTREGSTLRGFVNGVLQITGTVNASYDCTGDLHIGSHGGFLYYNGYMDELRITKTICRYKTAFNPPTSSFPDFGPVFDPHFSAVSLLLHMDGANNSTTFPDSSANHLAVTANGGAVVSTAQSKFGGSSAYFDGAGDYLTVPSSTPLELGDSDFTIEMWYYYESPNTNPYPALISKGEQGSIASDAWTLEFTGGNLGAIFWTASNGPSGGTPPQDQWVHVALTRSGSDARLFVDGVLQGTYSSFTNTIATNANGQLVIGCGWYDLTSRFFKGYIDELRITKGVDRYGASNFTPPTAPFPQVGGPPAPTLPIDYLVVAGGGGGGTDAGGGGGAGGMIASASPFSATKGVPYAVTVGAGGTSGPSGNVATSGSNSALSGVGLPTQTAVGGGRGGHFSQYPAESGGSGGGAGADFVNYLPGAGTAGQGYAGGNHHVAQCYQGGGGGAGEVGYDGTASGSGNGGNGLQSAITGSPLYYAGGGGGGGGGPVGANPGFGGLGGGGDGYDFFNSIPATSGVANTGGGGGGAMCGAPTAGGAGGSGVVIIRSPSAAVCTTGSPTVTTDGGDTVYTFTGSGSITF